MNPKDLTIAELFIACDFLKTLDKLDLATSQDRVSFQLACTTGHETFSSSFKKPYPTPKKIK